ncbi:MAG: family 43 glycosylhydrolase [Muribaculaceae bacterium]|nr:family 43 glycosylhydrolase [Muribaculaceae bacterium]
MNRIILLLFLLFGLTVQAQNHCSGAKCSESKACCAQSQVHPNTINGEVWLDTDGNPINAHGGGMMYHNGTYYWYGEYKGDYTFRSPGMGWECYRTDFTGVSCYSSKDLKEWKFEGLALSPDTTTIYSDLHPTMVIERPKVIYNEKTGKFVMWMHVDSYDYGKACAGVAISDTPQGPYTYLRSYRPNGAMSRDINVFKDDDGQAYVFFSSEHNGTMHICRLTDDYQDVQGKATRNFINKSREAPAVFKHNGKYYIISSGCTGWSPNEAEYAMADSPMGPYKAFDNPCKGKDAGATFFAQSTFVLPIQGQPGKFLAMFDRWRKEHLCDSRYVWLPVHFGDDATISLPWVDCWAAE